MMNHCSWEPMQRRLWWQAAVCVLISCILLLGCYTFGWLAKPANMPPTNQASKAISEPHILRQELLQAYQQVQDSNLITQEASEHMMEFRCNSIELPSCSFSDYSDVPISIEQTFGLRNLVGNMVHFRCYYALNGQPVRCEFRYNDDPEWHTLAIL